MQAETALVTSNIFNGIAPRILALTTQAAETAEHAWTTASAARQRSLTWAAVAAAAALLIAAFATWRVGASIASAVGATRIAMEGMAAGNLDTTLPDATRKDEIGSMARALSSFRDALIERRRLRETAEKETMAQLNRQAEVEALIAEFREAASDVLGAVGAHAEQGRAAARALSQAAGMADAQAGQVAVASHQISATSNEVASAIEEMAASVSEVARNTESTFGKVDAMAKAAARTEETIRKLSAAAAQVGQVTGLIREVADKTNLLSLNATIEAARAGEAGRGFAVVATEVKGLAHQTSQSTDEIGKLVQAMQDETAEAVRSIEEMAKLTMDAQSATSAISTAIQQQQAVSSEIARSVAETSRGSAELAGNIDGVSQVIKETASSAEQALATSDDLAANATRLRQAVDAFLTKVKAA